MAILRRFAGDFQGAVFETASIGAVSLSFFLHCFIMVGDDARENHRKGRRTDKTPDSNGLSYSLLEWRARWDSNPRFWAPKAHVLVLARLRALRSDDFESFYCLGSRLRITMSDLVLRNLSERDDPSFLEMQIQVFKGLEYLPRIKAGLPALDRQGSFIVERDGSIVGCIGLLKLDRPSWFEIRNLAVINPAETDTAKRLIKHVVEYVGANDAEYVKAFTPAVQPYVDFYKEAGFEPVRRSLRIRWDLATYHVQEDKIETGELSKDWAEDAAKVWIKGLRPYWDYWSEEQGGPESIEAWVKESVAKRQGWIGAFIDKKLVGLSILRCDSYGSGEARFNGAYAIPEFRKQGVGSALMNATIREAQKRSQNTMRVYTLAYLDHLAPGAVLYLKTGGRIEGEYLQLQKRR
jgi:N-acetylglutamate synthase-like GNAT family acetyltransferase